MTSFKFIRRYFLLLIFVFYAQISNGQNIWSIDNANSNVTFTITWRQHSFRTGEFKVFSGEIKLKEDNSFKDAEVNFRMDASSICLIANNLSDVVQDEEYLNTKEFPEITFNSSSIKKKHKNDYEVKGMLTIKGTSHEVVFIMTDYGIVNYEGRDYGALKVTGQINKSDFKIYGGGNLLGDIINITAYFETIKLVE